MYSSPDITGGVIYIGSSDGELYAFGSAFVIPEFSTMIVASMPLTFLAVILLYTKRKLSKRNLAQQYF